MRPPSFRRLGACSSVKLRPTENVFLCRRWDITCAQIVGTFSPSNGMRIKKVEPHVMCFRAMYLLFMVVFHVRFMVVHDHITKPLFSQVKTGLVTTTIDDH